MAENPDRFVIIDGVQVSRERAKRKGLLDAEGNPRHNGPTESRARTAQSARRPDSGGTHVAAAPAPAAPVVTAQVADGAVSVGEDAQRAGAADPGAVPAVPVEAPAAPPVAPAGEDSAAAVDASSSAAVSDDGGGDSSAAAKAEPAPKIRRR